jgi:selenophosphate synthetase-related protein
LDSSRVQHFIVVTFLILGMATATVLAAGQPAAPSRKRVAAQKTIDTKRPAPAEIQKRAAALQSAKASGDVSRGGAAGALERDADRGDVVELDAAEALPEPASFRDWLVSARSNCLAASCAAWSLK